MAICSPQMKIANDDNTKYFWVLILWSAAIELQTEFQKFGF